MAIIDFKEKERIEAQVLIKNLTKGVTTAGAPYYTLTLQDKTGTIDGKLWDASNSPINDSYIGKVVEIAGDVILYRNALQLKVLTVNLVAEHEVDLTDFVMSAKQSIDELETSVEAVISSLKNPIIKQLTTTIVENTAPDFYVYPAAMRNHHDFQSGLAVHVVEMLRLGEFICQEHPWLNRDLLLAGIILHDIGKTIELSGPILTEYTLSGKLIGHISLMQAIIHETAVKLDCVAAEETILLKHLILSHHGQYEFGSPVLPQIAEAECLSFIDNLDARLNMLNKALEPLQPGEFTSRIFSLENRSFYKPKID